MKKLFLLVATLFSLATTALAKDLDQGEDNGFGLKFTVGICGDKFGAQKFDLGSGYQDEWTKIEGISNTPLFGLSMDNRWYVANPGDFGVAISARWLDLSIGKSTFSVANQEFEATNVQLGLFMPGVIGTYYLDNNMAIDAFYSIGAGFGIQSSDADTNWGFGYSHYLGGAFRYKFLQAGVEYNIAPMKSIDWFSDDEEVTINDIAATKTRFNNLKIFVGFKF